LREALQDSGKIGIAKVVIRTREHLAGVKAQGQAIILEIMHFSDELVDADSLKFPKGELAREREVGMAKKLIDGMTEKWNPSKYQDQYKTQLMAMIEEKVKNPSAEHPLPKSQRKPTNVIDLMSVLEESLSHTKAGKAKAPAAKSKPVKARERKAA
jgi:DNA end-binding protein Ku